VEPGGGAGQGRCPQQEEPTGLGSWGGSLREQEDQKKAGVQPAWHRDKARVEARGGGHRCLSVGVRTVRRRPMEGPGSWVMTEGRHSELGQPVGE
jgi:hypothetical protein